MKIIISPAKKLSAEKNSYKLSSEIQFLEEAKYLVKELKNYKVADIKSLMGLSDNLAQLNYHRYQDWDLSSEEVTPAMYLFKGDVYQGLAAESFNKEDIAFAQNNLRILSGLYGLLKPMDLIFPYRLEMGTKLKTKEGNSLYDYWNVKLNIALSSVLEEGEELINLASNEYSKALKLKKFSNPVITPVFKDYKNGKLKVISFFAKKARGEMAKFIIKHKITNVEELKNFDGLSYKFTEHTSKGELLFTR